MSLQNLTTVQIAKMLEPHMDRPAWPGLDRPETKKHVRKWLKKLGQWEQMAGEFSNLPKLRPLLFRWQSMGRDNQGDQLLKKYLGLIERLSLGVWVDHPKADLLYLQDLLWLMTEVWTWVPASHQYCTVDLVSSRVGAELAEILYLIGEKLDPKVRERIGEKIEKRVLRPAIDCRSADWWWTAPMNWNSVCNANVLCIAFYRIGGYELANIVHMLIMRLWYSLQGFTEDGGCLEGTSYWRYGFGHYVDAATMIHHRTGGQFNMMDLPKVERICRFPLSTQLEGPVRAAFCDGGQGYISPEIAIKINRFYEMPELYSICRRNSEDQHLDVRGWRGLALYNGETAGEFDKETDHVLPEMGLAKLTNGKGSKRATLAVLAGSNDVPHNHNDIGTFVYYKQNTCWLTDPGGPVYTDKTFGPRRYEILQCRTLGHSCPIINGKEQAPGNQYRGELSVGEHDQEGTKSATIDMHKAYPEETLKKLDRIFELHTDGTLNIRDRYTFTSTPKSLEEAFVTYEPAQAASDGKSVMIGEENKAVKLRTVETPGRFTVSEMGEESPSRDHKTPLKRIVFEPETLRPEMELEFKVD